MNEPDLMAELDDAEQIISGTAERIVTEWGVRWEDDAGWHATTVGEYGPDGEKRARSLVGALARGFTNDVGVVKRKVTYGAWRDA